MSEGAATPFAPEGELTGDFVALLLAGRERGYLTPDDLLGVMASVELTPPPGAPSCRAAVVELAELPRRKNLVRSCYSPWQSLN